MTDPNPGGLPTETVDGIRAGSIADRAQLYRDLADGPFLASNRPGVKVPRGVRDNFWLPRMQPGHRNAYAWRRPHVPRASFFVSRAADVPHTGPPGSGS